jgi:fatty acid desaturase
MTAAGGRVRDPYQPFRQQMLSPARVKELSQLRPSRALRDIAAAWAVIVGAWVLVAWRTEWWSIAIAMVLVGTRYYALFVIGHDGLHRRLHPDRATNDLISDMFIFAPIGAITRLNNRNHLAHHQHLATDLDPDRHKHACFNKTDLTELLGYLSGVTSIARSIRNVFLREGRQPAGAARDGGYTARDLAIIAGAQFVIIGGLSLVFGWWGWPVLWLLPVYLFTYLGDSIRSFAEHSHPQNDEAADEHRLLTYESNALERAFLAPMNMNYHAAHHLWVSIPYYNLPVADAEMRGHALARDLEWRTSYVHYLTRYALAMPLEECRTKLPVLAEKIHP